MQSIQLVRIDQVTLNPPLGFSPLGDFMWHTHSHLFSLPLCLHTTAACLVCVLCCLPVLSVSSLLPLLYSFTPNRLQQMAAPPWASFWFFFLFSVFSFGPCYRLCFLQFYLGTLQRMDWDYTAAVLCSFQLSFSLHRKMTLWILSHINYVKQNQHQLEDGCRFGRGSRASSPGNCEAKHIT